MASDFELEGKASVASISVLEGQLQSERAGGSVRRDVVGGLELNGISSGKGFGKWEVFIMNELSIQVDIQVNLCEGYVIIGCSCLNKAISTIVMSSLVLLAGLAPNVKDSIVQVPSPQIVKGQGMSIKGFFSTATNL